jgi:hypothetical protein
MELHFRPMNSSELDLALFKSAFERSGFPKTLEHLRWQYMDNPTGRINVELALTTDESRVAGIVSLMPVALKLGEAVMLGCQALDTLTDNDFRGKGLFVKMAQSMLSQSESEGYACVYGFPNGNAAHGWFNRLQWTRLDPVPFLLKPLRLNYGLRKLPFIAQLAEQLPGVPVTFAPKVHLQKHQEFRDILTFDASFDHLWKQFSTDIIVAVHRDASYLNWRLVAKPGEDYRRVGLYENGELRGFVAWAVKQKHGGNIGYLMELIFDLDAPAVGKALLQFANREMFVAGAEVILAWNFTHSPNYHIIRNSGFWHLPESMRPIELHLGARALAAPPGTNPCNRNNWYLSYLDSDTV